MSSSNIFDLITFPKTSIASWFSSLDFLASQQPPHQLSLKGQHSKSNIFYPIKLVSNIFLSFVLPHHPHPPRTSCLHSSLLHQLPPRHSWLKTEGWSGNTKSNIINPIKLVSNIVFSFAHGYWRHFLHFIKFSAICRRRNNTIS